MQHNLSDYLLKLSSGTFFFPAKLRRLDELGSVFLEVKAPSLIWSSSRLPGMCHYFTEAMKRKSSETWWLMVGGQLTDLNHRTFLVFKPGPIFYFRRFIINSWSWTSSFSPTCLFSVCSLFWIFTQTHLLAGATDFSKCPKSPWAHCTSTTENPKQMYTYENENAHLWATQGNKELLCPTSPAWKTK